MGDPQCFRFADFCRVKTFVPALMPAGEEDRLTEGIKRVEDPNRTATGLNA